MRNASRHYGYPPTHKASDWRSATVNRELGAVNRHTYNIGNRTASARANAISEYAANFLNQYPPSRGSYGATSWHKRLDVDNVGTSAYEKLVTTGVYSPGGTNDDIVTSVTGHMFVAESPEAFSYDADGNLLTDGRWSYTWDADPPSLGLWRTLNPLISMQTLPGLCPSVPLLLCNFDYDYMSRRVGKTVYEWNTASNDWQEVSAAAFLYDGWNLVSEICNLPSEIATNRYVHGVDISGSLQGAGGVGGLLSAVLGTNSVCYTFDGNGNVSELLDIGAGTPSSRILAHYEYSPFGETIVATGDLAKDNPFRFSTKYTDDETSLVYYGYRFYNPGLGRWVNRDPIGEGIKLKPMKNRNRRGIEYDFSEIELNLCLFVRNNMLRFLDALGLKVQNNCSKPICVKPENDTNPIVIQPGDSYDGEIDGVSDCNGNVFKITNPYNNADIDVGSGGVGLPGPNIINSCLGGGKIKDPPDDGWKPLFNCAEGTKGNK